MVVAGGFAKPVIPPSGPSDAVDIAGAGSSALGIIGVASIAITAFSIVRGLFRDSTDRRVEIFGFDLKRNLLNPNAAVPWVSGAPIQTPPLIARWTESTGLDSMSPVAHARLFMLYCLGAGPWRGTRSNVWLDELKMFETFDSTTESGADELQAIDSDRKRFIFRVDNVDLESVVLFVDDVEVGRGNAAGQVFASTLDSIDEVIPMASTSSNRLGYPSRKKPEPFPVDKNGTIATNRQVRTFGGVLRKGKLKASSIAVYPTTVPSTTVSLLGHGTMSKANGVAPSALRLEEGDDGRNYFWVAGLNTNFAKFIKGWRVVYDIQDLVQLKKNSNGEVEAVFSDSIPAASKVSATFSRAALGKNFSVQYQWGDRDKTKLIQTPHGAYPQTRVIGQELVRAQPVTFEGTTDVDEMIVELHSGEAGFFDQATDGLNAGETRPAFRRLNIRIKDDGAPDENVTGSDPAKGWILVPPPVVTDEGPDVWVIDGLTSNRAIWTFSMAFALARAQNKKLGDTSTATLPRATYDVKLVTLDVAGNRDLDGRDHPSIESDVFLGTVTEVTHDVNLDAADLVLALAEVREQDLVRSEPVARFQADARECTIPDANHLVVREVGGRNEVYDLVPFFRRSPKQFTQSNIWNFLEFMLDVLQGAGNVWDWSNVNIPNAIAAEAYRAATVTNAQGVAEVRSELDLPIHEAGNVFDYAAQMMVGTGILPIFVDGKTWEFVIEQDETPVLTITDAHITRADVRISEPHLSDVPTDIEVQFADEEFDFGEQSVLARLDDAKLKMPNGRTRGRVTDSIDASGIRRRWQAERFAIEQRDRAQTQQERIDIVGAHPDLFEIKAGQLVTWAATVRPLPKHTGDWRVVLVAIGSNLTPVIVLLAWDKTINGAKFVGPNSTVKPGIRSLPATAAIQQNATTTDWQLTPISGTLSSSQKARLV